MLDACNITIAKVKDKMSGPDWENYFIKVGCLKVNNAYYRDKQNCRVTFANELTFSYF